MGVGGGARADPRVPGAAHAQPGRVAVDGRGAVDRHLLAAVLRHSEHVAPGRVAAAVLHAAPPLDQRHRQRARRDPGALGPDRRPAHSRDAVGRLDHLRPPRRADRRGAGRGQPLPHDVRARDAHVLADGAAQPGGDGRLRERVRLPPPPVPAGVRGVARGARLHPQLGGVRGRRPGGRVRLPVADQRRAARPAARRRHRLRRRRPALPALAAHSAPPGPAHRRALARPAQVRRARADRQVAARRRCGHRRAGAWLPALGWHWPYGRS